MKTPYYLISKQKLDKNITAFKKAFECCWDNHVFGYSVKTNSLPWLLSYLNTKEIHAEVVSDEEYNLAIICGFKDNNIIFNGPIKGENCFKRAIKNGAIINLDSKNDLRLLTENSFGDGSNIGIRVNLPPEIFCCEDVEYFSDGFRFGFSESTGDFLNAIRTIKRVFGDSCRFGLHLHCNSITRSVNVYIAIAKYAVELINKYNLMPSFVDIGGGFFGGIPDKTTPFEYISAIKNVLKTVVNPLDTCLIIEPGSAVIGSVVDLHTSVIDVKDTVKSRIVTTDGSRVHIDPLWTKTGYSFSTNSKKNKYPKQIICGYTCMDHDRLMVLENEPELSVGDEIVYHRIGAYSMTFAGMFIRYYPDVYVRDNDRLIKVRNTCRTDDYVSIQS